MSGSEKYRPKGFRPQALARNKIGPYPPLSTGKEVPARVFTAALQQMTPMLAAKNMAGRLY
jgi:hypothetical protein